MKEKQGRSDSILERADVNVTVSSPLFPSSPGPGHDDDNTTPLELFARFVASLFQFPLR